MRKTILHLLHLLPLLIGAALFCVALLVIHRVLKEHHPREVWAQLRAIPSRRLLLALAMTAVSFVLLSLYDLMAVRYIGRRIGYPVIARASFVGYAFSNVVGHSFVSGGAVRYRFYSASGLSVIDISKIMLFCGLTFWLGFFALAGTAFLIGLTALPSSAHFPLAYVRPLGAILLIPALGYVFLAFRRKRPFTFRSWELTLPSPRLAVSQVAVGFLDWAVAGGILYVLLPATRGFSYAAFIENYALAQILAVVTLVPGGIGVFDATLLLLLSRFLPGSSVLGSLLAFRAIYYALPLTIAAAVLAVHELVEAQKEVKRAAAAFVRVGYTVVPHVFSLAVFCGGALLLFSGATPAAHERLVWLHRFMPLPILEGSHFLGSIAGAALLLLAHGLQRRLDGAYFLALVFLAVGSLASLQRGLDYEEALVLSAIFLSMLPCRRYFYRRASLISQRFTAGWITAIALVLAGSIWLGLFSYRHVQYSSELWYHFAFRAHAPRFMRATVGASVLIVLFAMAKLLRAKAPEPQLPGPGDLARVAAIVRKTRNTLPNIALLGDKEILFSESGDAFIMYGIQRNTWVALGDPVGPREEWPELIWRFRETCDRHDGRLVFYEVPPQSLHLYLDIGMSMLKLGEAARVSLTDFSLEGGSRKGLRHARHHVEKEGCAFEIVAAEDVPALLPQLKVISDSWLAEKNAGEKRFSLGFFQPEYLSRFPAAIVRKDGKITAFANIWVGAEKEELSLDLMRCLPDAPEGVMDFLFVELMLWGKKEGYRWFNLGMAPLSGLESRILAPIWYRIGAFIFRHGEHFYNFQGLRQYKEKFDPVWEPRYLASHGGLALPTILTNLASLIAGGVKQVLVK